MSNLLKISFLMLFVLVGQSIYAQQAEYGLAMRYSDKLQGTKTSSGELYDANKLTAAHKTLPFGTKVKVTNMDTNKSIVVRINDRGPFVKGRVIDLSGEAAASLGIAQGKEAKVKVAVTNAKVSSAVITKAKPAPKTQPPAKKITPAKTETKTATRSLAVSSAKGYGVQVGSYSSEANARKRVEDLKKQWFKEVHVKKDKTLYKVVLGNFANKEQAETYLANLAKKNIDGFIINMKK